MAKGKRTRGKGFRRTPKQWEETISDHIGKSIDSGHLPDYLIYAALAYLGFETFGHSIGGAVFGPIALKLAQSPNIAASVSGVTGLALLGAAYLTPQIDLPDFSSWEAFVKKERERAKKSKYVVWR